MLVCLSTLQGQCVTGHLKLSDRVVLGFTCFWCLQAYKAALYEFWQYCKDYAKVKQTSEKRARVEVYPHLRRITHHPVKVTSMNAC